MSLMRLEILMSFMNPMNLIYEFSLCIRVLCVLCETYVGLMSLTNLFCLVSMRHE